MSLPDYISTDSTFLIMKQHKMTIDFRFDYCNSVLTSFYLLQLFIDYKTCCSVANEVAFLKVTGKLIMLTYIALGKVIMLKPVHLV